VQRRQQRPVKCKLVGKSTAESEYAVRVTEGYGLTQDTDKRTHRLVELSPFEVGLTSHVRQQRVNPSG